MEKIKIPDVNNFQIPQAEYDTLFIDPPIIAIVGERGDGKTLFMTALGYLYYEVDGYTIWSNYKIKGYPTKPFTFDDLASFPEDLHDAVILLDEAHVGVDAYQALMKRVKDITDFTTQIRKRNVIFIYSTQRLRTVAKRLRDMTNYYIEMQKTNIKGISDAFVFDLQNEQEMIHMFRFDGRQFFNYYNTRELIEL